MLFATLDPTSRAIDLPHGEKAILSDTVGFISDLPTMLVAAFRATLEDVIEADVLLHVRDVSHGETEAQAGDVARRPARPRHRSGRRGAGSSRSGTRPTSSPRTSASASPPRPSACRRIAGRPRLGADRGGDRRRSSRRSRSTSRRGRPSYEVSVAPEDGEGLAWLHANAEILDRAVTEEGRTLAQHPPHARQGAAVFKPLPAGAAGVRRGRPTRTIGRS